MTKNGFTFKLIEKSYREERYEAPSFLWRGCKIKPRVRMWYHTKLKYWDVDYSLMYGKHFSWIGRIYEKGGLNRKEARKYAMKYMEEASVIDINKLNDFYRSSILEESKR